MSENPVDKFIESFFNNLKVKNKYYSIQAKQPIFLIGEKDLHLAIRKTLESHNPRTN